MAKKKIDFKAITLREKYLIGRGGGIEIDLTTFGINGKMSAYQNYLGGGMVGRVCSDCNINKWKENEKLVKIRTELKEYFFNLTNPSGEWESQSFEQNQKMAVSAY